MRVTTGYNPYAYSQQAGKSKGKGFAEMYADRAGKNDKPHSNRGIHDRDREIIQTEYGNTGRLDPRDIRHIRGSRRLFLQSAWKTATRQPNADSKGDQQLTVAQAWNLRDRYDMENLTDEARHNLLCDLTDIGVLSVADLTADDQTKVNSVLEEIKTMKMGIASYVETEQTKFYKSDGRDLEFLGLEGEELYAAIVRKYYGGESLETFSPMIGNLISTGLITKEQGIMLVDIAGRNFDHERAEAEQNQGENFNLALFWKNYILSMFELSNEATKTAKHMSSEGSMDGTPGWIRGPKPYEMDEKFVKDFAAKVDAIMQGGVA